VEVTASNKNGSAVATSAASGLVAPAPTPAPTAAPACTGLPVVSGSALVGQSLSASTGSWSGSPTSYAYQWRRCDSSGGACGNVSGATAATYALSSGDLGFTLREAVTASNSGGSATAVSAQTAVVLSGSVLPASFYSGPAGAANVVPASGALLGSTVDATPSTLETNLQTFESQIGRKLDIYHFHYGYNSSNICYDMPPLSQGYEQWAWDRGVYSLVSWSPGYTIAQVNAGQADACFKGIADRFKAFGHPIWLRLWWEFNGTWFPWSYDPNNPQAFVSAWQRVVDIFKAEGATNTMFTWSPDEGAYKPGSRSGYPGDANVDWVASDAYNWNLPTNWCGPFQVGWCDFWQLFHHGYSGTSAVGVEKDFRGIKPFMAAETGSVEDPLNATHKGQWMQNMAARIKTDFPGLRALVYFNSNQTVADGANWRVDTSQSSLNGFAALAQDPYFHTR
jgi:hypothetical protein